MAETKISKEIAGKDAIKSVEYLSKVVKAGYNSQENKDKSLEEIVLSLDKLVLDLKQINETRRSFDEVIFNSEQSSLRIAREIAGKNKEIFYLICRDLEDDLVQSFAHGNPMFQLLGSEFLQNEKALKHLKEKRSKIANMVNISTVLFMLGFEWNPLVTFVTSSQGVPGWGKQKSLSFMLDAIDRVIFIMKKLLKEFKDEGITITPCVAIAAVIIDLFIRTSDGRYFAFMLRSNGKSKVKWREDRHGFFVNKKGNIAKWSTIDAVSKDLNDRIYCIKETKSLLMGTTSRERSKNVVKGIILGANTMIDPTNDPALVVDFGRSKALCVKTESIIYLVEQQNLANFLRKPVEPIEPNK
jgi:hypothetical protein